MIEFKASRPVANKVDDAVQEPAANSLNEAKLPGNIERFNFIYPETIKNITKRESKSLGMTETAYIKARISEYLKLGKS